MISEQWLDMYHRARSVGMTHATAMKILVDPEDLSKKYAVPHLTLAELERRHALMREFVNGAMSDIIPDICPKCHGMKVSGPYVKGQSLCMCECDEPIINRIIDARAKVEATGKAPGYIILGQIEFDRLNEEVKELDYRFYSINMEGFMIDGLRIVVDPVHESRIDVAVLRPRAK